MLIKNGWEVEVGELGLLWLARKLKCIKNFLREWNKSGFGNTVRHIRDLEQRVEVLEQDPQMSFSKDTKQDLLTFKVELDMWICRQEI